MSRPDDDVARDAWLSEALRHAPDADAAPPAALSETILRQARAAAAAATPVPTPQPAASWGARLSSWWSWLGRPPVAAGFASVMVAGVVGLMWWDRSPEELMPPRVAVPTATAPPATAPAEAPAAVAALPAPAPAQPAAPTAEPAAPRVAARAPAPPPAAAAKRAEVPRQAERERSSPAPAVAAPERLDARRTQASDEARAAATGAAGAAAPPAPAAPRPAPPVALADAAPPPSADAQRSATAALESDSGRAERSERARLMAPVSKAAAPALQRDSATAPSPLPALRAAIASQPERWHWQRDGAALQPLHDPLLQWLRALDTTAVAPWQPVAADAAARGDTSELSLWFDGRLHTRVRLGPDAIVVAPAAPGAPRQRATLPAADAATLRAALDRATR